jgi:hypothetical protein
MYVLFYKKVTAEAQKVTAGTNFFRPIGAASQVRKVRPEKHAKADLRPT